MDKELPTGLQRLQLPLRLQEKMANPWVALQVSYYHSFDVLWFFMSCCACIVDKTLINYNFSIDEEKKLWVIRAVIDCQYM